MMAMFVRAAGEMRDVEALAWAESQCLDARWSPRDRYAVSQRFLMLGEAAAAWAVFTADPAVMAEVKFAHQAKSFLPHTKDAALRSEIRAAMAKAVPAGAAAAGVAKATATAIRFPFSGSGQRARGTVEIRSSERTPPRHAIKVAADIESFRSKAARAKPPEIIEHREVFVDRNGQIWKEDGSVLVSKGAPISRRPREDVPTIATGFLAIKGTRGIYHWLVDRLPLFAWMLEDGAPDAAILLSDEAPSFEKETLRLAGLPQTVVDVGDAVFVERLLIARSGMQGFSYWEQVAPVIERVKQAARAIATREGMSAGDAIYISRRDSSRRVMRNEAELEEQITARGYASVALGTMPLWRQVFVVSSAKRIVAPHGAGLAHIIFSAPGTDITEIVPVQDGTYFLRLNYARLSLVMGHRYRGWLEPHLGTMDSWAVDAPAFLEYLDAWPGDAGAPVRAEKAGDRSPMG
ncbi:glycosyltransferase family 61 protein [Methylobacterium sp. E-045]|uniref:glycosyltransferase family 61 protein n=1 Tax=Methylobacterium sp. E-045 TaxID=2836575 RepID=UPI001FB94D9A|nr:glycosyltransferase family 61 protein [Methylobacterium sp. E-045]MCJ2127977.1 glycosyltransferase family 61 protein [Methylobacterium sp. E-045]